MVRFIGLCALGLVGCSKEGVDTGAPSETGSSPLTGGSESEEPCGAAPTSVTLSDATVDALFSVASGDLVLWAGPDGGAYWMFDVAVIGTLDPLSLTMRVEDPDTGALLGLVADGAFAEWKPDACGQRAEGLQVFVDPSTEDFHDEACALDGRAARLVVEAGPTGAAPAVTETVTGAVRALWSSSGATLEQSCP